ncbi:MAG: hypothetical protein ABIY63_01715 [Fibrobacteria bacterium]
MRVSHPALRILLFPLTLLIGSCTNDSGEDTPTGGGGKSVYGTMLVTLQKPSVFLGGNTTILGSMFTGPTPLPQVWEETAKSGSCRLLVPRTPFCVTPCGSGAACIEDDKCQDYPDTLTVGPVTVKGLKTKSGPGSFIMKTEPEQSSYQVSDKDTLIYPPFAEGDSIVFSAAGNSSVSPFTMSVLGISPLQSLKDSLTLEDGKPINLAWTPPAKAGNSTISVLVDISHHGGTRGLIECEGPDAGSLTIPAALVDKLKVLGISGYPKIELTRKAAGKVSSGHALLSLESGSHVDVYIPGIISCEDNDGCPTGQECQVDLQCK